MRCCSFFILQHKPQTSDTLLAQPIASRYHTHSTHIKATSLGRHLNTHSHYLFALTFFALFPSFQ